MAYTSELSYSGSATQRRLAWFRGKPMTKTLEALLEATGRTMAEIRSGEVCARCKDDSTCEKCAFLTPPRGGPLALLLAFGWAKTWREDFHPTSSVPCPAHTSAMSRARNERRLHLPC